MQRTQIFLDRDLAEALDRIAERRGTSRGSVIREAARRLVEDEPRESAYGSILALIGIGADTAPDVAARHDDYLADAEIDEAGFALAGKRTSP